MRRTAELAALLAALSFCLPAGAEGWRARPLDVVAVADRESVVHGLDTGTDGGMASAAGRVSLELTLPRSTSPWMLTFARHPRRSPANLKIRSWWAAEVLVGGAWRIIGRSGRSQGGLERVIVPPRDTPQRIRLRAHSRGVPAQLSSVGLYDLQGGTGDVWLVLGASIQADAFDHLAFKQQVGSRFGGDPVVFNRAVHGWTSANLLEALPALLEKYAEARYVAIHIGGNNVSHARPFPGGAARLRQDLIALVDGIRAAGKQPILARLSYRAYRSRPRVGPEGKGSGPYVEAISGPISGAAMPRFFDHGAGRGTVDPYGWFRAHPEELGRDGVHLNAAGRRSWVRLWVDGAAAAVYGLR